MSEFMESDAGLFSEARPAPYQNNKSESATGTRFNYRKPDPLSQVVILVCAPTPPHAPFFISGNISTILGYKPEEIIGNRSFWMNTVHTEDTPQLLSGFFHLFTRGYHIYDYRFLRKDGACKQLLVELHLHRCRKKEPIAIMAFLRESVATGILRRRRGGLADDRQQAAHTQRQSAHGRGVRTSTS